MKKLTEDDVEFIIKCEQEYIPVRGNAMASGDNKYDKQVEDQILNNLEYNPWAWCCVVVEAHWNEWVGYATLGCCSYEDEDDFKNGGYFDFMKAEALEDLNRNISNAYNSLKELV